MKVARVVAGVLMFVSPVFAQDAPPPATQIAGVRILSTEATETARSSEIGTNVSRQQIENLPNFERNFLDIAKLVPGITATAVNNSDKFLAAGGQPAEAVNIFVDGATYKNDVLRGGVVGQDASKGNPFPQAAVQERPQLGVRIAAGRSGDVRQPMRRGRGQAVGLAAHAGAGVGHG